MQPSHEVFEQIKRDLKELILSPPDDGELSCNLWLARFVQAAVLEGVSNLAFSTTGEGWNLVKVADSGWELGTLLRGLSAKERVAPALRRLAPAIKLLADWGRSFEVWCPTGAVFVWENNELRVEGPDYRRWYENSDIAFFGLLWEQWPPLLGCDTVESSESEPKEQLTEYLLRFCGHAPLEITVNGSPLKPRRKKLFGFPLLLESAEGPPLFKCPKGSRLLKIKSVDHHKVGAYQVTRGENFHDGYQPGDDEFRHVPIKSSADLATPILIYELNYDVTEFQEAPCSGFLQGYVQLEEKRVGDTGYRYPKEVYSRLCFSEDGVVISEERLSEDLNRLGIEIVVEGSRSDLRDEALKQSRDLLQEIERKNRAGPVVRTTFIPYSWIFGRLRSAGIFSRILTAFGLSLLTLLTGFLALPVFFFKFSKARKRNSIVRDLIAEVREDLNAALPRHIESLRP